MLQSVVILQPGSKCGQKASWKEGAGKYSDDTQTVAELWTAWGFVQTILTDSAAAHSILCGYRNRCKTCQLL